MARSPSLAQGWRPPFLPCTMREMPARLASPADRHEVVHTNPLYDERLAGAIGVAVHVMRRFRRYRAALARQQPIDMRGARVSTTIGPSRQTKLSLISLW